MFTVDTYLSAGSQDVRVKIINVTGDNKLYVNESYLIGIEGKDKNQKLLGSARLCCPRYISNITQKMSNHEFLDSCNDFRAATEKNRIH